MADADRPIILFDGVCVFCSASMRFIFRHDATGAFRFAALQSGVGRALAAKHGVDIENFTTFYVLTPNATLERSQALFFVARHLAAPWRWLGAFGLLPRPWLDGLYDIVARNRYRIAGRRRTCYVPSEAERARFLT